METIEIPAHVDFSVGNIHFIGNVRVRGGVHPGFSVEAAGSIEIQRQCGESQHHRRREPDDPGHRLWPGRLPDPGRRQCPYRRCGQARVEVQGNLTVDNYLRHSHCDVGGLLEVTGQKATLWLARRMPSAE